MNRFLLLFVLFFGSMMGHASAAAPPSGLKITADTISMTWSRMEDCWDMKATFQFNVPYPFSDVDTYLVDLDDGQGPLPYRTDWVYNYIRYTQKGLKNIRFRIVKKDGHIDSLNTTIDIVDTRVLFGRNSYTKEVPYDWYPHSECAGTMENTVVSHRWDGPYGGQDGDCIRVTSPGRYILQTWSATCHTPVYDTVYIKTKDYAVARFEMDSAMLNCGVMRLFNTSFGLSSIVSALWEFEDGTTSNDPWQVQREIRWSGHPEKIKLTVTSASGVVDSVIKYMLVYPFRPERVNLGTDTVLFPGQSIRLSYGPKRTGNWVDIEVEPNKVEWSTGETTREITIKDPGVYWVKVTPCQFNNFQVFTDTLIVNKPQSTVEVYKDPSGPDSMTYRFIARSNFPPDNYTWDFGDNTTANGWYVTHRYTRKGKYLVKLYVQSFTGYRDSVEQYVTVTPPPLKPRFTYLWEAPKTYRYTATSEGIPGNTPRYTWDFGDGTTGSGATVSHEYQNVGKYSVVVTAHDTISGEIDSLWQRVSVWPALNLGPDTLFRGAPIVLKLNAPFYGDTSVHCTWQPAGVNSHELTVTTPGTYVANVTAPGFNTTDTVLVLKDTAPFTDFFNTGRSDDGKLTMIFATNPNPKYPGVTYWDFGDHSPRDSGVNLAHTYVEPGYYDVKMWRGLYPIDTARKRIYMAPPIAVNLGPDVMMPASQQLNLDGAQAVDSFYRNNFEVNWKWSTGATGKSITVTLPGTYWLTAAVYGFSSTDTIVVLPTVVDNPNGTMSYYAAEGSAAKIYFENTSQMPLLDSTIWLMGDGNQVKLGGAEKRKMSYIYQAPGTYEVTMLSKTADGQLRQTKEQVKVWPELNLGPDTTFIGPDITLKLNAPYFNDPSVNCVWYPGVISGHQLVVRTPGTYYAKVTTSHYSGVDTVYVKDSGVRNNFDFAQNDGRFLVRFVTYHFGGYRGPTHWSFGDGTTDTALVVDHHYPGPGTYTVKMWKGYDLKDTIYTITKQVTLLPLVTVNLGPDRRMADANGITLDAEAAVDSMFRGDRQVTWKWSTGEASRLVTIKLPGIYTLTATRYGMSATDTIEILPPLPVNPAASMEYTAKAGNAAKIYFENTSQITGLATTKWTFGDGTGDFIAFERKVEHTFSQPGEYSVAMQSQTTDGHVVMLTEKVKVWPSLDLGPDQTYIGPTIELKVNDPYFYDPSVQVVWYPDVVNGKSLQVRKAGTYYAKVTAPHYEGVDTVHVLKGTFWDEFSYAVNTGNRLSYNFAPYMEQNETRTPYWLFGDGSPKDSGTLVTHVFPAYGSYVVKMWKGAGNGDTISKVLKIMPPLVPAFSYKINTADPKEVTFTNISQNMDGGQYRSEWDFGDGATATLEGPANISVMHRYQRPGDYTVRIKVRDNAAGSGDTSKLVTVPVSLIAPQADFQYARANDGLYTLNFTNASVAHTGNVSASWSFGDGTSATSWNAAHTYAAPGEYQVKLVVQDSVGLKDSLRRIITIVPHITLNLGADTMLRNAQPIWLEGYKAIGGIIDQVNWLWSTGDTTHYLQVTQPGTYWLRATRYGYTVADTIIVSVPAPLPPVVDSNAHVVQVKDSVPVTVSFPVARNADNVYTIQLANADNGPIPGARAMAAAAPVVTNIVSFASTDPKVAANIKLPADLPCGKQYRIRVVASSPADNSAWSAPFEVVNMPAIPQIAQRGDTLESSTAAAYQWYKNGMPIPGATDKAIRAKADGSYQVQVSAGGDCNAISAPLAMIITGLENVGLTVSPLTVYPNPSSGAVYLQLEKQPAQPLLINVYNTSGRIVHSLLMKDKQTVLDLSHMPKGLYYVQVSGREKQKPVLISIQ